MDVPRAVEPFIATPSPLWAAQVDGPDAAVGGVAANARAADRIDFDALLQHQPPPGGSQASQPGADPRASAPPEPTPEPNPEPTPEPTPERGPQPAARPARAWNTAVLGQLAAYAEDPAVTDLFVNGDAGLWVDRGDGARHVPSWNLDEAEVRALAVHLVALGGRHVDEASPCVDVRLGDGIRVHAVLPPVSSTGTLLSVRLPQAAGFTLAELESAGMFGAPPGSVLGSAPGSAPGSGVGAPLGTPLGARLRRAVAGRENILVTGAAGSGKTTLLSALLAEAGPAERIVTIEDVAELRIRHPHVVGLEARQANLEGAGRLGLDALLREALRMRPDRLVVGECRGAEIRELLAALNTGHDGGAGTLHANSLADVPARLEALGSLAGMSADAVARQTVSAIGLLLHLEQRSGVRRLAALGHFELDPDGRLAVEPERQSAE